MDRLGKKENVCAALLGPDPHLAVLVSPGRILIPRTEGTHLFPCSPSPLPPREKPAQSSLPSQRQELSLQDSPRTPPAAAAVADPPLGTPRHDARKGGDK